MKEFPFDISTYIVGDPKISEVESFRGSCHQKRLERGEWLLTVGQRCHHAFFILRGVVRQYSIDKRGREHTLFFAAEGQFLANIEAVCLNMPSSYFIQALEDLEVIMLSETDLRKLSEETKHFGELRLRLLHEHILHQQKRITQLQADTAEERYLTFVEDYPEMMLRVPQHHIASYLGITPESLSRIRKSLAKKHSK